MHILGCGAALPLPGRNPTAQLVNVHEKQFLLDCGEGTQIALKQPRIRMMRIEHIAISHLHEDHYFGLPGLLSTFNLLGRTKPLRVYGPEGLEEIIKQHERLSGTVRSYPISFHVTSVEAPEVLFEDGTVRLESFPVRHRIPTTGFLIREQPREPGVKREVVRKMQLVPTEVLALKRGEDVQRADGTRIAFDEACHPVPPARSYGFAADTRYWEKVAEWVRGVDLLYHEATFGSPLKAQAVRTFHSTAEQAARIALKAGVGKLIIGHVSARYEGAEQLLDEAQAVFPNTVAAVDGMVLEIPVTC